MPAGSGAWWQPPPAPASDYDDAPAPSGSVMPSKDQISYAKEGLELALLLAAVPYLLYKLATDPSGLLKGLGARRLR